MEDKVHLNKSESSSHPFLVWFNLVRQFCREDIKDQMCKVYRRTIDAKNSNGHKGNRANKIVYDFAIFETSEI